MARLPTLEEVFVIVMIVVRWKLTEKVPQEREKVLEAVCEDGMALGRARQAFLEDKLLVLAAVKQNGMALQFAAQPLQGDIDVVQAAVKSNPKAYEFATDTMRLQLAKQMEKAAWEAQLSALTLSPCPAGAGARRGNHRLVDDPSTLCH